MCTATGMLPQRNRTHSFGRLLQRLAQLAIIGAIAGTALSLFPATAEAKGKIAVIDLRRAVLDTEDGLRVQATLKQLRDSRQSAITEKEKAIQQAKAAFEKLANEGKLPKAQLQQRYESLQKQLVELQAMVVEFNREMQRIENDKTTPILQRIMSLIRRVAAQQSYDMVLDKAAVPYFRSDLDITDRIIQMYNSGEGTGAPKKKPDDRSTSTPKR